MFHFITPKGTGHAKIKRLFLLAIKRLFRPHFIILCLCRCPLSYCPHPTSTQTQAILFTLPRPLAHRLLAGLPLGPPGLLRPPAHSPSPPPPHPAPPPPAPPPPADLALPQPPPRWQPVSATTKSKYNAIAFYLRHITILPMTYLVHRVPQLCLVLVLLVVIVTVAAAPLAGALVQGRLAPATPFLVVVLLVVPVMIICA